MPVTPLVSTEPAAEPRAVVRPPIDRSISGQGAAVMVILAILLVAALIIAKSLIMPIVVAILLNFLLTPAVRWFADNGVPRLVGALMVLGLAGGTIGTGSYYLSAPAIVWMERLPAALTKVEKKLHILKHHVDQVNDAAHQVEALTSVGEKEGPMMTAEPSSNLAIHLMSSTGEVLACVLITSITLFFLLATGGTILDRLVTLIPALRTDHDSSKMLLGSPQEMDSTMVLRESERLVGLYMRTTIITNAFMAVLLSTCFWSIGLPNPLLWGVFAGILNFLPYIGPLIGVPVVAVVSLVSFDSLPMALLAPLTYSICSFIGGNIITPFILGKSLTLSPIAIFLWMALWGWMWGPAGAMIAVPMLVMAKSFCSRIDNLKGFARLMEP